LADPLIITILLYLHVISAMGWLGGAILFLSVIAPGLRSLSPPASLEFLVKVGPKSTRFFIGAATSTVIFGIALFIALAGDYTSGIYVGISLGLLAYLTALLVAVPSFNKADRLAKEIMSKPPGPPPPEFQNALKRGGIGVTVAVVLLLLAVIFMVASGVGYF
jgi:uncharacterized membrane protein